MATSPLMGRCVGSSYRFKKKLGALYELKNRRRKIQTEVTKNQNSYYLYLRYWK